jgi:hypothetical protein
MVSSADKSTSKLFVGGRLGWPEGSTSRKSIKAVRRLSDMRLLLGERVDPDDRYAVEHLADLVLAMLR